MANWIDRLVTYVSPKAGVERARARYQVGIYRQFEARNYDGADRGKHTARWRAPGTSANAAIAPALDLLRNRSRDLVRNNPYAERAVRVIQGNVVGAGIVAQPRVFDSGQAGQRALEAAKRLWGEWAESRDCDADGRLDLYGMQSLVMRTIAESGEVLVRRRWRRTSDGLSVPVQMQVLEPDFLDTTKDGTTSSGGIIIRGVEFDVLGQRVAYWLFSEHPGETGFTGRSFRNESKRVPAADIEHLYRVDRAGQVRGIPFGAPCIIRLRDFDEYEGAQLLRQKLAAAFAGYMQDIEAPVEISKEKDDEIVDIDPGAILRLPPGKTITFPNTPQVSDDGHASRVLHAIAIGFGVTYESLTGDFKGVNFSSGRMGWLEFGRNLDQWQWHLMIPGFCVPAWRWFREAATLAGSPIENVSATWTPPRREMIDPTREIPARIKEIRAGLKSLSGAIRENGFDPDEQLEQIAADAKKIDGLQLILDSDPRKTMSAGSLQSSATGGSSDENQEEVQ